MLGSVADNLLFRRRDWQPLLFGPRTEFGVHVQFPTVAVSEALEGGICQRDVIKQFRAILQTTQTRLVRTLTGTSAELARVKRRRRHRIADNAGQLRVLKVSAVDVVVALLWSFGRRREAAEGGGRRRREAKEEGGRRKEEGGVSDKN